MMLRKGLIGLLTGWTLGVGDARQRQYISDPLRTGNLISNSACGNSIVYPGI